MKNTVARISFFVCIACMVSIMLYSCSLPIFRQQPTSTDLNRADALFEEGSWKEAITEYQSYLSRHPVNPQARLKLGRSLMEEDRIEEALEQFQKILADGDRNHPEEVYFRAGRACHQLGQFSEAEHYYRQFAERSSMVDLQLVNYYMKQIGAARTAGNDAANSLVENAGHQVNSVHDEFHPVYSPNIGHRFYFTVHDSEHTLSIRSTPEVGASMKYAEVTQGIWKTEGTLDDEFDHSPELRLLDFSENGQHVFFTRPVTDEERTTLVGAFESGPDEPAVRTWDHPVFQSRLGDRDLFTIHDSAYLFSSQRLEGYGGYDLYVTFKSSGNWMVQNLGPQINSPADEIAPFLSVDGRQLYFSSNSDKSIGGYDVFFATFDDEMETWGTPQNMLPPVNSGRNDVDFRLSGDGQEALLSSDRTGGHGGFDIYHVYFDQPRTAQLDWSQPRYFYQVSAFRSFALQESNAVPSDDKPVFELPVLHFGERPLVITPQIKGELDKILEFGRLYPHVGLLVHVFTEKKANTNFGLYRPVLILKNAIDYLQEHGLDMSRIEMRLHGHQYPRSSFNSSGQQRTASLSRNDRRVEFEFTNTKNLPVRFVVAGEEHMRDDGSSSPYQNWKSKIEEVYFRIRLADAEQLLKRSDFVQNEDLMLAVDGSEDHFTYYSGIFQKMEAAQKSLRVYIAQGYMDARIVAFIGPSRIPTDLITSEMIEAYPELKKYIIYQK
ncbi:tetratricopeptide repeat protein [Membranicola marinus]|uniref:Tetratricopeptide repeat protein n=1 Tax=Membranihabitans marinus TaxID=1227546 RepID=A0A953L9S5_9BACT|nr:tetratricopeptide repeat protein [Membranihabitans marinus]MBY5957943.1 tetratricopeptide repeat protein [Membranihabitans marinus]